MRWLVLLALCSTACTEEPDRGEQELIDQQVIAAVEAANDVAPPLDQVVPEPLQPQDMEQNDIYGAVCSYAPGTSLGIRVIARQADAFMKIDGEVVRFASDPGARELANGTRSLYNGKAFSLRLELAEQGTAAENGTVDYEGDISLRDRFDRIVYRGSGIAHCAG